MWECITLVYECLIIHELLFLYDIKLTETQDGVVLYCVIRLKDEFQDLKDNDTSAIRDIFRQTCDSPDEKVPKRGQTDVQ